MVVINAYWLTITSELTVSLLTFVSLFFNAVFTLFILVAINGLVRSKLPDKALTAQELLTIYIMVVMVSTVGGHTLMTFLVGIIAHPIWFATSENEWGSLFGHHIPSWFVADTSVLENFYSGESSIYTLEYVKGWIVPVLAWTGFIALIWFVLICLNVLIRRQWVEYERLAYPIIQLPVRMTVESQSFWRHHGMWLGVGVAALIEILAGLNYLFPAVPSLYIKFYSLNRFFTEAPWNHMGWLPISAFPFIIGLTFFVPLDISFTAWFFYLLKKAERVVRQGMLGEESLHFYERAGGAWIAVGVLAVWGTRRHLLHIWQSIIRWPPDRALDDSGEPLRYQTAIVGLFLGLTGLIIFSAAAGMSWLGIVGFLVLYLVMSFGVTRVRSEQGPPSHEILYLDPARLLVSGLGAKNVGTGNLTILSFYYWLNRLNTAPPMPNQLEAFKIAERAKISSQKLVWVMMLATVVGTLASFWAYLDILYHYGADSVPGYIVGIGWETFGHRLQTWLTHPAQPGEGPLQGLAIGAIITSILYFLRGRFFWWPFSPIGYAMIAAPSGGLSDYWFSVFLGWLVKLIIVKQSGLKFNQKSAFFFLGLILGDYVTAIGWSLIGVVFNVDTYVLW